MVFCASRFDLHCAMRYAARRGTKQHCDRALAANRARRQAGQARHRIVVQVTAQGTLREALEG
jgi:hypothetical protein